MRRGEPMRIERENENDVGGEKQQREADFRGERPTSSSLGKGNNTAKPPPLKASVSSGGVKTTSSSREKSFLSWTDATDGECREETDQMAVSWFPPATTTQKDDGKDAGEDDGGAKACRGRKRLFESKIRRRTVARTHVRTMERRKRRKIYSWRRYDADEKGEETREKRRHHRGRNGLLHKRAAREAMKPSTT